MHKILLATIAIVTGTAAVTSLYADGPGNTGGSAGMMSPGMMGEGGMMSMTEQTSDMMEHCSRMMQGAGGGGSGIPNEQWKKETPATPEKDG